MIGVRRCHYNRSLIVEQLRDGFLGGADRGEAAVEDVALPLELAAHRIHAQRDSSHRILKSDSLEVRADQAQPRLLARRRSRRTDRMLVRIAIGERKNESHLARALSARFEIVTDVAEQRVDDEDESLRIF